MVVYTNNAIYLKGKNIGVAQRLKELSVNHLYSGNFAIYHNSVLDINSIIKEETLLDIQITKMSPDGVSQTTTYTGCKLLKYKNIKTVNSIQIVSEVTIEFKSKV